MRPEDKYFRQINEHLEGMRKGKLTEDTCKHCGDDVPLLHGVCSDCRQDEGSKKKSWKDYESDDDIYPVGKCKQCGNKDNLHKGVCGDCHKNNQSVREGKENWKAKAQKLLDKDSGAPSQEGLGYRGYLRAIIAGTPTGQWLRVKEPGMRRGAESAAQAIADITEGKEPQKTKSTTIKRGSKKFDDVIKNAKKVVSYSLGSNFTGVDIDGDSSWLLDQTEGKKVRLTDEGGGNYKLRFHSNLWYELQR